MSNVSFVVYDEKSKEYLAGGSVRNIWDKCANPLMAHHYSSEAVCDKLLKQLVKHVQISNRVEVLVKHRIDSITITNLGTVQPKSAQVGYTIALKSKRKGAEVKLYRSIPYAQPSRCFGECFGYPKHSSIKLWKTRRGAQTKLDAIVQYVPDECKLEVVEHTNL